MGNSNGNGWAMGESDQDQEGARNIGFNANRIFWL